MAGGVAACKVGAGYFGRAGWREGILVCRNLADEAGQEYSVRLELSHPDGHTCWQVRIARGILHSG